MNEINDDSKKLIYTELKKRNISLDNYDILKRTENRKKSEDLKCPRCKAGRVIEEDLNNKIVGIWTMDIALKYAPWTLKNRYRCELCGYRFKKWPRLNEIWERLWMD